MTFETYFSITVLNVNWKDAVGGVLEAGNRDGSNVSGAVED